ncbi:MAG: OmpW family outer membrane protein [Algibacter sp.]
MRNKFILIVFFALSISVISQNKKFSIDINYPLALSDGEFDEISGIIDGSIKYRFKETDKMYLGISYTFDLLKEKTTIFVNQPDLNRNYTFHHLGFFEELIMNSNSKFRPFIGLGYSILSAENESFTGNTESLNIISEKNNSSGFNFNIGTSYDILDHFFIQAYFHYIRIFRKSAITDKNIGINFNQLKLGLGYRF